MTTNIPAALSVLRDIADLQSPEIDKDLLLPVRMAKAALAAPTPPVDAVPGEPAKGKPRHVDLGSLGPEGYREPATPTAPQAVGEPVPYSALMTNYTIQKRERERLEGELRNCESQIREQRAEINRLATLSRYDIDAIMALALEWACKERAYQNNRSTDEECNAAMRALRAKLEEGKK